MAFQAKYDKGDKGRTHEESRQVICACCGKKVKKYNQTKAQTNVMSSKYEQLVKKHIFSDYSICNENYPTALCDSCRPTLVAIEKAKYC